MREIGQHQDHASNGQDDIISNQQCCILPVKWLLHRFTVIQVVPMNGLSMSYLHQTPKGKVSLGYMVIVNFFLLASDSA